MQQFIHRRGVDSDLNFEEVSFSTSLILETAKEHDIKCEEIPYTGIFLLKYRGKSEYLHPQPRTGNTRTALYCCKNKAITKTMLAAKHISVPKGYIITKKDKISYRKSIYKSLNKPIVVKPINSSLAFNVFADIRSESEYLKSIKSIYKHYGDLNQDILVEEMFIGTEYRVFTTDKKILGIMARIPANVIGDGTHTIEELVVTKNLHPWRGGKFALHHIVLGKPEIAYLKKNGLTKNSIPAKHEHVQLHNSSTTNIDHGGDTIDVTNKVHPSVKKIILKAVKAIPGLSWAGMDFFSKDITKLQGPKDYIVLEINTSPNIAWQEFPAVGPRRGLALEYLKVIFPELKSKPKKNIKIVQKISQLTGNILLNYISPTISP